MKLINISILALTICTAAPFAYGAGQLSLVMVPKGVHPYYEPCYQGFKDAGIKYGVKTEYRAAKAFEVPQQVEIIENLIALHVDGISVSALDDNGLKSVIQEATDSGIKVITFDAPAPSSSALCYIGTDNESAGYQAADELIKVSVAHWNKRPFDFVHTSVSNKKRPLGPTANC